MNGHIKYTNTSPLLEKQTKTQDRSYASSTHVHFEMLCSATTIGGAGELANSVSLNKAQSMSKIHSVSIKIFVSGGFIRHVIDISHREWAMAEGLR